MRASSAAKFGGVTIGDGRDFARAIADARNGSAVPVTVLRDGRELALNLRIGADRG